MHAHDIVPVSLQNSEMLFYRAQNSHMSARSSSSSYSTQSSFQLLLTPSCLVCTLQVSPPDCLL